MKCVRAIWYIKKSRMLFNNPAPQTLGIGKKMLLGELEYHKGNYDIAFFHPRESVQRCDVFALFRALAMHTPPRHTLGAPLWEHGHYKEAEDVYCADLGLNHTVPRCAQHKNNVWPLHGIVKCLKERNEETECKKLQGLLREALSKTDLPITPSCCCRNSVWHP